MRRAPDDTRSLTATVCKEELISGQQRDRSGRRDPHGPPVALLGPVRIGQTRIAAPPNFGRRRRHVTVTDDVRTALLIVADMLSTLSRTLARPAARHARAQTVRWASQAPPPADGQQKTGKPPGEPAVEPVESEPIASGSLPTLDFMPGQSAEEPAQQRTGARSSKDTLSSAEKRRKVMSRVLMALLAGGAMAHTVYLGREWEEDELKEKRLVSQFSRERTELSNRLHWCSLADYPCRDWRMHRLDDGLGLRKGSRTYST